MMKRTILVALCLILLIPIQVDAAEQRATVYQPILSFSGTTALCEFDITDLGKKQAIFPQIQYKKELPVFTPFPQGMEGVAVEKSSRWKRFLEFSGAGGGNRPLDRRKIPWNANIFSDLPLFCYTYIISYI